MKVAFKLISIEISQYHLVQDAWQPSDADVTGVVHLLKFAQVGTGLVIPKRGRLSGWPSAQLQFALNSAEARKFELGKIYLFTGFLSDLPGEPQA